jgi:hypothetical protein
MKLTKHVLSIGIAFSSTALVADGPPPPSNFCLDYVSEISVQPGTCTPPSSGGQGKRADYNVYMGLVWSFDGNTSKRPDLVVGYRSTDVKYNDRVSGGDLNLRFSLAGTASLEGVRLSYVSGNRDVLGNIGLGYSFKHSSPLLTGAIQAAHVRGGSDFVLNTNKFLPYVELNSLKPIKRVRSGSSCIGTLKTIDSLGPPFGDYAGLYLLSPELAFPGAEVGGLTCFEESDWLAESDIRLKHDIHELAVLENGLKIYSFKYKSRDGDFVGVMAQDLLSDPKWSDAVIQRQDGHYLVNYGALGIRMTTLENWNKNGKNSVLRSSADLRS